MNRPGIVLVVSAIVFLSLSGCASMTSPARTHALEPGKPYIVDYDATRRGSYVLPADGSLKVCSEPSPDAAMESITKIIAELKLADNTNIDAKTQIELQTKVVELAGRSQLVLILRESLYRLCEQGMNGGLSQEQIAALYQQVLQTVVMLAQTDLAREQKEIIDKLQDPELRRIFQGALNLQ